MRKLERIDTPRLILRELHAEDAQDIFEIVSDEETCLDDGGFHAYVERNEEFDLLVKSFLEQRRYGIILKEENKLIGLINLMDDKRAVLTYELGFVINKNYRRCGYGYEAISKMIETYFEKGTVEMFTACHFPYNKASENLIRKLGFVYEGIERKAMHHVRDGIIDLMCYYKEK